MGWVWLGLTSPCGLGSGLLQEGTGATKWKLLAWKWQKDKPNSTSTFHTFAPFSSANMPLVNASPMAKLNIHPQSWKIYSVSSRRGRGVNICWIITETVTVCHINSFAYSKTPQKPPPIIISGCRSRISWLHHIYMSSLPPETKDYNRSTEIWNTTREIMAGLLPC